MPLFNFFRALKSCRNIQNLNHGYWFKEGKYETTLMNLMSSYLIWIFLTILEIVRSVGWCAGSFAWRLSLAHQKRLIKKALSGLMFPMAAHRARGPRHPWSPARREGCLPAREPEKLHAVPMANRTLSRWRGVFLGTIPGFFPVTLLPLSFFIIGFLFEGAKFPQWGNMKCP